MSEMVHYIITNETVLMEQYENNRGPGPGIRRAKLPWSWNTSSFWML